MRVLMAEYAPWDSVFRLGSHRIARRFLEGGWEVLWLVSYWNVFTPLAAWRGFRSLFRLWRLSPVLLEERVCGFSPFTALPFRDAPLLRSELVGRNTLRMTVPPLGWWLRKNGWDRVDLLWITAADLVTLPGFVNHKRLIYRVTDRHIGFSHIPRGFGKIEEGLIKAAHAVFATSRGLYERAKGMNPNSHLLPNAVDDSFFRAGESRPVLKDLPRPRVVYVGSLENWVDFELLESVARLRPSYSFVLAGPRPAARQRGLDRLGGLSNVCLMGPVENRLVPGLLREADVGIIPFSTTSLTHSVSPLKLYEYLAAGLPVVSTPLEETRLTGAPVIFGSSPEEFARGLDNAVSLGTGLKESYDFARQNTWSERLRRVEAVLEGLGISFSARNGGRDS